MNTEAWWRAWATLSWAAGGGGSRRREEREAGTGRGSCKKAGTGWKAAGKSSIDILSALGRRQHKPVSSVVVFVPLCTQDIFDDIQMEGFLQTFY